MTRWVVIFGLLPVISGFSPAAVLASDLADRIESTHRKAEELRADFTQKTFVEILEKTITEKGDLYFSRGGKFLVRYRGENARTYESDGKRLKVSHKNGGETEVYDVGEMVSREALSFLSGLGEMRKQFRVSETGPGRLKLIPRDAGSPFSNILISVQEDRSGPIVAGVVLFPKQGNRSEYSFSKVRLK